MDLIKREDAIWAMRNLLSESVADTAEIRLNEIPTEVDVVYCKDCVKHNNDAWNYFEISDKGINPNYRWREQACPLVLFRGKAQGHEADYQYCVYGRRKDGSD